MISINLHFASANNSTNSEFLVFEGKKGCRVIRNGSLKRGPPALGEGDGCERSAPIMRTTSKGFRRSGAALASMYFFQMRIGLSRTKNKQRQTWVGNMRPYQIIRQPRPMGLPCCKSCGAQMWLASIEPADKPDHDKRTFECPRCQDESVEFVKYR